MRIFEKVQSFFNALEEQSFYIYVSIFLSLILVSTGGLIFYYYRTAHYIRRQITYINDQREEVRILLEKAQIVQQQRAEVNALLEEDENFKIGGYFKDLLSRLGLLEKQTLASTTQVDKDEEYRERILTTKLIDLTMKELTELLNEIEQTKRIYTKELEITKTKKNGNTIEVDLVIATLEKKSVE